MANKLFFSTLSSALLYKFELEGQISDGKYENSRPHDHWRWAVNAEIFVDPLCERGTTRWVRKTYNLNEWPKYMRDGKNGWARRALAFCRLGKCFDNTTDNFNLINEHNGRWAEYLPQEKPESENWIAEIRAKMAALYPDWERGKQMVSDFMENVMTDEVLEKYYSVNFDIKDFNLEHKLMKETVNTQLRRE